MKMDTWRNFLKIVAVIWLAAAFGALCYGPLPRTSREWIFFIAFGPPLYILGEAFAEWIRSTRISRAIFEHSSAFVRLSAGVALGACWIFSLLFISEVIRRHQLFGVV